MKKIIILCLLLPFMGMAESHFAKQEEKEDSFLEAVDEYFNCKVIPKVMHFIDQKSYLILMKDCGTDTVAFEHCVTSLLDEAEEAGKEVTREEHEDIEETCREKYMKIV